MAFDRDLAWDILAEFSGVVDGSFTPVGEIGQDYSAEYDATLDQLAALGVGFDRDLAWEILVEFSAATADYSDDAFAIPQDNTMAYSSALDQLEGCYSQPA